MLFKNTVEESTFQLLLNISINPSFDKFHLVGGTALSLQIDIITYYCKKYRRNEFQILKPLVYFTDADAEPDPVFTKSITWKPIKTKIQLELEKLLK